MEGSSFKFDLSNDYGEQYINSGRGLARESGGRASGPRRGSGGEGRPDGSDVSFLERCKVLENESSFQKYQHFVAKKIYFS